MYYLSRHGANVPAEAPYASRVDGRYEWDYGQRKHQEAVRFAKGQVDQSLPRSINPAAQTAQANTRRFFEDQRHAEIGRENQKLVNKLQDIARGVGAGNDPRAPPPAASLIQGPPGGSHRAAALRPSAAQALVLGATQSTHSRSLNETHRRKEARQIAESNSALVRRILATGPTFDRKKELRDFQRHKRAVGILQRFPDKTSTMRSSTSLPSLRPPRPGSDGTSLPPRGLQELLLPSDLQRYEGGGSSGLFELEGAGASYDSYGGSGGRDDDDEDDRRRESEDEED